MITSLAIFFSCGKGRNLVSKYKQALEILHEEDTVTKLMASQGILDPAVFSTWLEEEREFLEGLKKEPEDETLEIEYYQKLTAYYKSQYVHTTSFIIQIERS